MAGAGAPETGGLVEAGAPVAAGVLAGAGLLAGAGGELAGGSRGAGRSSTSSGSRNGGRRGAEGHWRDGGGGGLGRRRGGRRAAPGGAERGGHGPVTVGTAVTIRTAARGPSCPDARRLPGALRRTGVPAGRFGRPGPAPGRARPQAAGRRRALSPGRATAGTAAGSTAGTRRPGGHGGRFDGRLGLAAPPDPPGHDHLVLLDVGRHPAPGGRLADIAHLGNDQFRQALAFQDRPGGQPGKDTGWQHIQPEQGVTEGEPEQREEDHVRHGDGRENGNLAHRKGHREPEVVELVQPLLDPPDAGIGGQLHQSFLPSAGAGVSRRRPGPSLCPGPGFARCSGCRRPRRSRQQAP